MNKEDEVGDACRSHENDHNYTTGFKLENLKGRDHLEDLGFDRETILSWKLKDCLPLRLLYQKL
jgi:hypothetical protein